jgi:hypothetical protein
MPDSKRFTVSEKPHYRVDLEYNDSVAILHLPYLEKFTRSAYEESFIVVQDLLEFVETVGYDGLYAAVYQGDKKIQKFLDRLGFKYSGKSQDLLVYQIKGK